MKIYIYFETVLRHLQCTQAEKENHIKMRRIFIFISKLNYSIQKWFMFILPWKSLTDLVNAVALYDKNHLQTADKFDNETLN